MPDTMSLCNTGGSVLLNSQIDPSGNTFTWTTGGSTIAGATGPSYTASAAGKYYLCYELTGTNCPKSDSVIVLANKFYINLGPDVTLCNPPNLTLDAGVTSPPVKVRWYKNNALIGYDSVSQLAVNAPGTYRAEAYLPSNPGCGVGKDSVTISTAASAVPNNTVFCSPPSQNVSLSVTGSGTYEWYANSTGATLAAGTKSGANGQNFTTNVISTSMTYYVEDQTVFEMAVPNVPKVPYHSPGGNISNTSVVTGFIASAPFRLDSVTVFAETYNNSGKTINVTLYSGTPSALTVVAAKSNIPIIQSNAINVPNQIYLGFSVPAAGNYYLGWSGGNTELNMADRDQSTTANYPSMKIPGLIQLTGIFRTDGTTNAYDNDKYFVFYNWIVGGGTLCGRVPVYSIEYCTACTGSVAPTSVSVNNPIYCAGLVSQITLSATGGSGDNLVWYQNSCGGTQVGTNTTGADVTITAPGTTTTYYARWESAGCNSTCLSVTVTVSPNITAPNAGLDKSICADSVKLKAASPSIGTGQWSLGSSGSGNFTNPSDTTTAVFGLSTGRNRFVWTVTGCGGPLSDTVDITVGASTLVIDLIGPADTTCFGADRQLYSAISGGSGNYNYKWTSTDPAFASPGSQNSVMVNPQNMITRYYLSATDLLNGCTSNTDSVILVAVSSQELIIPNLITPNGDYLNDVFEIRGENITALLPGAHLEVTNRWGERVYKNSSYNNTWKGESLSDGVYYYYVMSGCGAKAYKGWIYLVR